MKRVRTCFENLRKMSYFAPRVITTVFLFLLISMSICNAQTTSQVLQPNKPITFSLSPNESRSFSIEMKEDDFAEINWLANDSLILIYGFVDETDKVLSAGSSSESDSAVFIAPKGGFYRFVIKYELSSEVKGVQNISLEYKNVFKFPAGTKQKDIRRINGYDIKIFFVPETDSDESIVTIEKGGRLKKLLRDNGNATYIGFSFPDNLVEAKSVADKRGVNLIRNTLDKTGDGVPDVMIDYFSGGAHCCFSTYFINLGPIPEIVEVIHTEHAGLAVSGTNPKGGLRFKTSENTFAYWNIFFAGSPMPSVFLEFSNGKLTPNFDLLRKAPPSLSTLKAKARAARLKINDNQYSEVGMDFVEAFWGEMLDLIYTGNEDLAWQYFDLVWPSGKTGKERFLTDFKKQLAESYYGTKGINTSNSFRNFMNLFEKNLRQQ